jgi:hypothetical protein
VEVGPVGPARAARTDEHLLAACGGSLCILIVGTGRSLARFSDALMQNRLLSRDTTEHVMTGYVPAGSPNAGCWTTTGGAPPIVNFAWAERAAAT